MMGRAACSSQLDHNSSDRAIGKASNQILIEAKNIMSEDPKKAKMLDVLHELKVHQLKAECGERGAKKTGNKTELKGYLANKLLARNESAEVSLQCFVV